MKKRATVVALATILATPAWAAVRTVTLSVPGMTCPACPITVKTALSRVDGVRQVDIRSGAHEAIVTFDDAKASMQKLTDATARAGYPSSVEH